MSVDNLGERLKQLRIIVIGDPIHDVYHHGRVTRFCPEAPVPVFVEDHVEIRMGGALNVRQQLLALGVRSESVFSIRQAITEKHRYMVGHHQLLRVDNDRPLLFKFKPEMIEGADAVILSDYDKGVLTPQTCQAVIDCARSMTIPVVVDPKGTNFNKYAGCTVICPNEVEAQNPELSQFSSVLRKKGSKGLSFLTLRAAVHYPAVARQVYDVTGAGDTVVAVFTAMLAAGLDNLEACRIANIAAGHVVGIVGTATIDWPTLKTLI